MAHRHCDVSGGCHSGGVSTTRQPESRTDDRADNRTDDGAGGSTHNHSGTDDGTANASNRQ
ncbi:hypothetical protein GCM10023220_62580 [Streptomyces ziwulingensis]|uniref:Uncharacterized protein n=1 Tax=Streptomyces ziwulingensis TaxID=1045501 RepID=A0ABP9CWD5_9ACTN